MAEGAPLEPEAAANHHYLLEAAVRLARTPRPRILDFGCGQGAAVALGRGRGLDIVGADTFDGPYADWRALIAPDAADHVRGIVDGRLPFEDASFDVVVSNQVFEHVREPAPALGEIARVLRDGGAFLAIFPDGGVAYEGHVGLYGPHWLRGAPRLQELYLRTCHRAGLGLYREGVSAEQWARDMMGHMRGAIFYHRRSELRRLWRAAFGVSPRSLRRDFMLARLNASPRWRGLGAFLAAPPFTPVLAAACALRAGSVLLVYKSAALSARARR